MATGEFRVIRQDLLSLGMFSGEIFKQLRSLVTHNCCLEWSYLIGALVNDVRHRRQLSAVQFVANGEVRSPEWHVDRFVYDNERLGTVAHWHHDDGTDEYSLAQWVVVWASVRPTEILMPDGSIFSGEPYEIIAFRNGAFKHRIPSMTRDEMSRRWFARSKLEPKQWPMPRRSEYELRLEKIVRTSRHEEASHYGGRTDQA